MASISNRASIATKPPKRWSFCATGPARSQGSGCEVREGELSLYGKLAPQPTEYLTEKHGIGECHRTFAITTEVDAEKIAADYHDGVLSVHLPKQEKVMPKSITVKAG